MARRKKNSGFKKGNKKGKGGSYVRKQSPVSVPAHSGSISSMSIDNSSASNTSEQSSDPTSRIHREPRLASAVREASRLSATTPLTAFSDITDREAGNFDRVGNRKKQFSYIYDT